MDLKGILNPSVYNIGTLLGKQGTVQLYVESIQIRVNTRFYNRVSYLAHMDPH